MLHEHKGGLHTRKRSRASAPPVPTGPRLHRGEQPVLDTTPAIRTWAAAHKVELCLTPTNASWADLIEAEFGPLRMFTMADSDYPNHIVLARDLHAYLRWRNANADTSTRRPPNAANAPASAANITAVGPTGNPTRPSRSISSINVLTFSDGLMRS